MSRPVRVDFGKGDGSSHTDVRAAQRRFNRSQIASAVVDGVVIEFRDAASGFDGPTAPAGRDGGFTRLSDWTRKGKAVVLATVNRRPVHVVVVIDAVTSIVEARTVTVYEPAPERWDVESGFAVRLRQEVAA